MKVPLLDLAQQENAVRGDVASAVLAVLDSQRFILGPEVEACEEAVARYSRCAHAVGVSSGSDAILISLMAAGIQAGDEVITTPFTFFATVGAVVRLGARPVFVDIDPDTFNIDATRVAQAVTERTRAIIPVHLYGQMADMAPILDVAREHDLAVVEDAAQAIGAERSGTRAGSAGHYGCLSFFPSKNLGAAGDAGMVVTNDPETYATLRCLRGHGSSPKYYHRRVGGNFRLDALQAAVIRTKLPHLDAWTEARRANAERYDRLFDSVGLVAGGAVKPPPVTAERHVFNQYVLRVKERDALAAFLKENEIDSAVYYPLPMHLQQCFVDLGHRVGDFPEAEQASRESLAIPIAPHVSEEQTVSVVDTVARFYG